MARTEYYPPLTIFVEDDYFLSDPEKTEFLNGDTISPYDYMEGVTLFVIDSADQEIPLKGDYFPDIEGTPWQPGYTIDIENLPQDSVTEFKLSIPNISDLQMYVVKVPMLSDVPTFDIVEDSIEDVAEICTDWSEDNDVSFTCNFCLRDAFYKITGLTILYPDSPNNACIFCDPEEYNIDGGLVEGNGTANTIYNTLTDKDSDLAQYFEEIYDIEGEDYPDFTQMQLDADNGQLIIGAKSSGTGHVVLLMPEDLWDENSEHDIDREIRLSNPAQSMDRPIALECGQSDNKRAQPVRWGITSLQLVKWYRYKGL